MVPFIVFRFPALFLISVAAAMQKKNALAIEKILTCIIYAFSLMQMRGIGTCGHSCLFQAFRNEAGALK